MEKVFEYEEIMFYDISHIKDYISKNQDSLWNDLLERKQLYAQEATDIIYIYNLPDSRNRCFNTYYINDQLIQDMKLQTLFIHLSKILGRRLGRAMFVKLPANTSIAEHTDYGYHLENCYRIHLPIVTNDKVKFIINKTVYYLATGIIAKINNNVPHEVLNESEHDRVHLIMDFVMPYDKYYDTIKEEFDRFI
jgi:hypothetical protein